jgi:hypothetical protein
MWRKYENYDIRLIKQRCYSSQFIKCHNAYCCTLLGQNLKNLKKNIKRSMHSENNAFLKKRFWFIYVPMRKNEELG